MMRLMCPLGLTLLITCAQVVNFTTCAASACAQELGSTATIQSLGVKPVQQLEHRIDVRPAPLPSPQLKYRFSPSPFELTPRSAQLHFARACLFYGQINRELRTEAEGDDFDDYTIATPSAKMKEYLQHSVSVLKELRMLALCEDLTWDHRLRDINGPAMWTYPMPDLQEARDLGRLLCHQAKAQFAEKNFDEALLTVRDGYRFSRFMSSGETVIQQLIGIAIAGMMHRTLEHAIAIDGCPNLYCALASATTYDRPLFRSLEIELNASRQLLPVVQEIAQIGPDDVLYSNEEYWQSRWRKSLEQLSTVVDATDIRIGLTVSAIASRETAKATLAERGLIKGDRLDRMAPTLAMITLLKLDLDQWSDILLTPFLMPYPESLSQSAANNKEFRDTCDNEILHRPAFTILANMPAFHSIRVAQVREILEIHRLMTIEALRLHASEHDNVLPRDLKSLAPMPAMNDPFTGEPLDYTASVHSEGVLVSLKASAPDNYRDWQNIKILFKGCRLP